MFSPFQIISLSFAQGSTSTLPRAGWIVGLFQTMRHYIKLFTTFWTFYISSLPDSFLSMQLRMIRPAHHLEVLNSIVKLVFIKVVDTLMRHKLSAQKFLHNISMLKNLYTVFFKELVSFKRYMPVSCFSIFGKMRISMPRVSNVMFLAHAPTKPPVLVTFITTLYNTNHVGNCSTLTQ